jgi:hypothetical protein
MLGEIKSHFGFKYDLREAITAFKEKFPYKSKNKDQPDVGVVGPF